MNKKTFIILIQFVAILYLLWFLWQPADNNHTQNTPATSSSIISPQQYNQLLDRLDHLENERLQESSERQQLIDRITQLENLVHPSAVQPFSSVISDSQTLSDTDETDVEDVPVQQKLINQGLPPQTANQLQRYVDEKRLQRLNLRDQAIREGWRDSDEYMQKMNALGDAAYGVKQEFGEQVYDQYLYASGRPNRVIVREVINESVAQSAGLIPGDMIVRYANESIFSMNDLREATSKGVAGESILLEILRDNQPYSITIARGPLGISMDSARIQP